MFFFFIHCDLCKLANISGHNEHFFLHPSAAHIFYYRNEPICLIRLSLIVFVVVVVVGHWQPQQELFAFTFDWIRFSVLIIINNVISLWCHFDWNSKLIIVNKHKLDDWLASGFSSLYLSFIINPSFVSSGVFFSLVVVFIVDVDKVLVIRLIHNILLIARSEKERERRRKREFKLTAFDFFLALLLWGFFFWNIFSLNHQSKKMCVFFLISVTCVIISHTACLIRIPS